MAKNEGEAGWFMHNIIVIIYTLMMKVYSRLGDYDGMSANVARERVGDAAWRGV